MLHITASECFGYLAEIMYFIVHVHKHAPASSQEMIYLL